LVRTLGFGGIKEWYAWCKSDKRPANVPSAPKQIYAGKGWVGFGDWLGNDELRQHVRQALSFEEARAFVRALGLKSGKEWKTYCRSGKKPANIPNVPNLFYADKGWVSWPDWLGYERRRVPPLPFEKACAFVRALGLKSAKE
jgi:hypothetical protein